MRNFAQELIDFLTSGRLEHYLTDITVNWGSESTDQIRDYPIHYKYVSIGGQSFRISVERLS